MAHFNLSQYILVFTDVSDNINHGLEVKGRGTLKQMTDMMYDLACTKLYEDFLEHAEYDISEYIMDAETFAEHQSISIKDDGDSLYYDNAVIISDLGSIFTYLYISIDSMRVSFESRDVNSRLLYELYQIIDLSN
jgi:hypothetical protein